MSDEKQPTMSVRQRILNPYRLETRALVLYHILVLSLAIFTLDRTAAYLYAPSQGSTEILLVGSPTCPHSRAVRRRFVEAGVSFREVDSKANPLGSALAAWTFQSLSVPIVVVGDEVIYGNRSEKIDEALAALEF